MCFSFGQKWMKNQTYSNIKVVQRVIFREWLFHDPCFELISYGWLNHVNPWWRKNPDSELFQGFLCVSVIKYYENWYPRLLITCRLLNPWLTFVRIPLFAAPTLYVIHIQVPSPGSRPLCFTWATSFMKPLITMVPKIWLIWHLGWVELVDFFPFETMDLSGTILGIQPGIYSGVVWWWIGLG